jgi:hypothetical protein
VSLDASLEYIAYHKVTSFSRGTRGNLHPLASTFRRRILVHVARLSIPGKTTSVDVGILGSDTQETVPILLPILTPHTRSTRLVNTPTSDPEFA